jgi:hypothetical protein
LYDLVIREFKRSGITQSTLAHRWGKAPEVVSRFLARPANWEVNTWTEALFAISGAIPTFGVAYPSTQTQTPSIKELEPPKASTDTLEGNYHVFDPRPAPQDMKAA